MYYIKTLFALIAGAALLACQPAEEMGAEDVDLPEPAQMPADTPPAPTMPSTTTTAPPMNTVHNSLINDATWVNLFEGHDLSQFNEIGGADWNIVGEYVESTSGEAGFLVTRGAYGDVHLMAEFWTSPDANSGIFMRCQDPNDIGATSCYEVNIFDQRPDQTYRTGGIVNFAEPMAQLDAAGQWNTFDIVMEGDHLVVRMNDTLMVDTTDSEFANGVIGFQWSAGTVRFRNIRLRPL